MLESHAEPLLLGVNIDHVATLREARGTRYPDPLQAALLAEQAGADAITLHLREDRRHIRDRDLTLLTELSGTRINLEMAATPEMARRALEARPSDCCLVPERREELTTEGGLNVVAHRGALTDYCANLGEAGIRVSLFIDAEPAQIEAAAEVGAPAIELHTGHYANASGDAAVIAELARLRAAARLGKSLGLRVNAGHGLHYHNVSPIAAIPGLRELNIGHAIVARALFVGFEQAVRDMKALLREAARR